MLDFQKELLKYHPILELENIHSSLQPSQLKDLIDVLEHIATDKEYKNSPKKIIQKVPTNTKLTQNKI